MDEELYQEGVGLDRELFRQSSSEQMTLEAGLDCRGRPALVFTVTTRRRHDLLTLGRDDVAFLVRGMERWLETGEVSSETP